METYFKKRYEVVSIYLGEDKLNNFISNNKPINCFEIQKPEIPKLTELESQL